MGHDILRCKCGHDIMEGHHDWLCDKCGNYYDDGKLTKKYIKFLGHWIDPDKIKIGELKPSKD